MDKTKTLMDPTLKSNWFAGGSYSFPTEIPGLAVGFYGAASSSDYYFGVQATSAPGYSLFEGISNDPGSIFTGWNRGKLGADQWIIRPQMHA
jgi:hypothetical protein